MNEALLFLRCERTYCDCVWVVAAYWDEKNSTIPCPVDPKDLDCPVCNNDQNILQSWTTKGWLARESNTNIEPSNPRIISRIHSNDGESVTKKEYAAKTTVKSA